jgi:hypothetical protein
MTVKQNDSRDLGESPRYDTVCQGSSLLLKLERIIASIVNHVAKR